MKSKTFLLLAAALLMPALPVQAAPAAVAAAVAAKDRPADEVKLDEISKAEMAANFNPKVRMDFMIAERLLPRYRRRGRTTLGRIPNGLRRGRVDGAI